MPEPSSISSGNAASNGHAKTNGRTKLNGETRKVKASRQDITALIEEATKLRTALHDLLHQASALVKSLKQHRRQSRAVQNTIASLRQLKTLGV